MNKCLFLKRHSINKIHKKLYLLFLEKTKQYKSTVFLCLMRPERIGQLRSIFLFALLRKYLSYPTRARRLASASLRRLCAVSVRFSYRSESQQKPLNPQRFCVLHVRPGRIELPNRPWQGRVIPLNHGRIT